MKTEYLFDDNLFWMLLKLNVDVGDSMEGWTPRQKRLWSAITVVEQEKGWQVSIVKHLHESGRKAILKRLEEVAAEQKEFIPETHGCWISKACKISTTEDEYKYVVAWVLQDMAKQYQDFIKS